MEFDAVQQKLIKKDLRRRFSVIGWTLLIYYGIMNVSVFVVQYAQMMISMIRAFGSGNLNALETLAEEVMGSAWGYFLAAAIGLIILLAWKKPAFWKNEIWAKGNAMKPGSFLVLLCLFLSGQLIYQIVMMIVEMILNSFGLSVLAGMEAVSMDTDNFGMFLYGGILAPITEELLFRGLIQRTLRPYGKRFAILCSAFTFGIFHGNLLQAPYAFLVGLVLGYVASEYSIGWAMLLHMINNLMLGDMLSRITFGLPDYFLGLIMYAILIPCGLVSLVILIVKRHEIRAYRQANPINKLCRGCFFSCGGSLTLMIVMGISMILSIFVMVTPL